MSERGSDSLQHDVLLAAAHQLVSSPDVPELRADFITLSPSPGLDRQGLRGIGSEREALGLVGDACVTAGLLAEGEGWYEEQLALMAEDDEDVRAEAMARAGACLLHFGHLEEAMGWLRRAAEQASAPILHLEIQHNIGHIFTSLGRFEEAIQVLEPLLSAPWAVLPLRGRILRLIGHSQHSLRRFAEAVTAYQAAVDAERQGDSQGNIDTAALANSLDQVGHNHGWQKDFDEALRWHREAVAVLGVEGDPIDLGRCLHNVGHCLRKLEQHTEAREVLQRAEELLRKAAPGSPLHLRCQEELALCEPAPVRRRRVWLLLPGAVLLAALLSQCLPG
jgi:tetratricopeptide (TPR) repeat protein